jgi:hypothetical protein
MHHVVAQFETMDDARSAMVDLERAGIEAGNIELRDEPALVDPAAQRTVDLEETGAWIRRGLIGGVIGAVVGAVVITALVAMLVDDVGTTVVIASLLAGAAFGGSVGAFWSVAGRLPVNEQAMATRTPNDIGGRLVEVAVRADDDDGRDQVMALLRPHAVDVSDA